MIVGLELLPPLTTIASCGLYLFDTQRSGSERSCSSARLLLQERFEQLFVAHLASFEHHEHTVP
jgi:hypothetical protein